MSLDDLELEYQTGIVVSALSTCFFVDEIRALAVLIDQLGDARLRAAVLDHTAGMPDRLSAALKVPSSVLRH